MNFEKQNNSLQNTHALRTSRTPFNLLPLILPSHYVTRYALSGGARVLKKKKGKRKTGRKQQLRRVQPKRIAPAREQTNTARMEMTNKNNNMAHQRVFTA